MMKPREHDLKQMKGVMIVESFEKEILPPRILVLCEFGMIL